MIKSGATSTNNISKGIPMKQTVSKSNYPGLLHVQGHNQPVGNFHKPTGTPSQNSGKPVPAGVTPNSHPFSAPSTNQNGTTDHVTSSQPHDLPSDGVREVTGDPQNNSLANTKEKTPMCLVNELARYNKVTHQYTLVDEQGPAHKKTFYVKLQLGDKEEYSASGASIKKAQHAAAASALEKTEYKHPPPKPKSQLIMSEGLADGSVSLTPTVELNALAMKRGEPAIYRNIENRGPPYYQPNYDFRGMYNQRYHFMRPPRLFYVSLKVGSREFIGEGPSRQQARHNAAKKALEIIKMLPMPEGDNKDKQSNGVQDPNEQETDVMLDDTKSEISVVHEIALRHNLPVSFDVIRESGPPHMKVFITQCIVGTFKTEADGNSKKLSKKRAADLMLKELRHLQTPAIVRMRPKQKPVNKKKNRNLIKMQKADPTYGVGINPISRLIQIQQAQKKKEPLYTLVAERGLPRRREFVMQVQVDEHTCTGVGPNKKLAKRHAAEAMLQLLGYNKPSPQPSKPAIKMQGDSNLSEKKVTFSDADDTAVNGQSSRQMVPGLIVLPEGNRSNYTQLKGIHSSYLGAGGMIETASFGVRPEIRLKELCKRNNIDVKFDEFSGSNNPSEFLSRVMIASNPIHTLHGSGPTPEASRDEAALTALKVLFETGVLKDDRILPSGDAPQIKG